GLSVQLDRCVRREYPGTSACRLLRVLCVRCTIRPQKEARVPARDRIEKGAPIGFGLEHRQAIMMWPDTSGKQRVPVHQQVLRSNRRSYARTSVPHELNSLACGYVLKHNTKPRVPLDDRGQNRGYETHFPIEYVHTRIGYFAVNLENDT